MALQLGKLFRTDDGHFNDFRPANNEFRRGCGIYPKLIRR